MASIAEICTCTSLDCPLHPTNHDQGCDLCIQKNLKLGEIPSCFFNAVGDTSEQKAFFYKDFAEHVLKNEK